MTALLMTLFLLVCFAVPSFAADRYVRKNGNNGSSTCSSAAPCLTIARGAQVMNGGDTLWVGPGTYAEKEINLNKSGSSSAPTTLRAEGAPGSAIIKWPGAFTGDNESMLNLGGGSSWIVIDGMTLDASDAAGNLGVGYIINTNNLSDVTMRRSVMRGAFASCWVAAYSNRITLEDSTVIGCGHDTDLDHGLYWGGGGGNVVQRNTFIANAGHNIQIRDFASSFTITRNRFTGSRLGVILTTNNGIFANNFVWDEAYNDHQHAVYGAYGGNLRLWNNTFWNSGLWFRNDCFGTQEVYNTIHTGTNSGIAIDSGVTVLQANNLPSNPGFVQASTGNLHLATGTNAAINTGRNIPGGTMDIDGDARPAGQYDIGADEFGGVAPPLLYHLALGTPPNSTTPVGAVMVYPPSFEIHDPAHAIQTAPPLGTTTVTLALVTKPVGGVMSGTLVKAATAGIVEYTDLTFTLPGTYVLRATATLPSGVSTADSDPFVILAVAAPVVTSLTFATQPGDTPAGATIAPVVVQVRDQDGAAYTATSVSVNLQIAANPASGVLSGTRRIQTVPATGQATFADVSISAAVPTHAVGTPYTLQASVAGPILVTSSPFAVTPPPPKPDQAGARQTRAMVLGR